MVEVVMAEITPATTLHLALMGLYFAFIPSAGRKAVPIGLFAVFAVLLDVLFTEHPATYKRTPHCFSIPKSFSIRSSSSHTTSSTRN